MRKVRKPATETLLVRIGLSMTIIAFAVAALGCSASTETTNEQPSAADVTAQEGELLEDARGTEDAPSPPPFAVPTSGQEAATPAPGPDPTETDAAAPGAVSGALTMNGEEIALTHGCALRLENEEGYLDEPMLLVLLADQEVSPDLLKSPLLSDLMQAPKERGIRFVFLSIGLSEEAPGVGGLAVAGSLESVMPASFTLTDAASGLLDLAITDARIQASIDRPESATHPEDLGEQPFALKAEFDLAVSPNDPITAHLTGEEAVNSPQVAAFSEYFDAIRNADVEALKKVASGAQAERISQAIEQVGAEAFKEGVSQGTLDAETFKSEVSDVFVRGARAVVMADDDPWPVVLEGETWKVQ